MLANFIGKDNEVNMQAVKDDLNVLKSDAMVLSQSLKESGEQAAHKYLDQVSATGKVQLNKMEAQVKENPAKALLLTFLAGAAATYLFRAMR